MVIPSKLTGNSNKPSSGIAWGVNIPWWNEGYCHDLGKNYIYPHWPVTFDESLVESTFEFLNQMNIRLIRFWLFEGGEGIVFDEDGVFQGIDETFLRNLQTMCSLVKKHKLKVYYTLLDANSIYRNNDFVTDSILGNGGNTDAFCDLILPKILPLIEDTTWAIDICNEPEAAIRGDSGNYSETGYSWSRVTGNISRIIAKVRMINPDLKISVGSGFQEERNILLGYYSADHLDLDFLDYHTHRTDGFVPQAAPLRNAAAGKKIVIGELSACEKLVPPITKEQWIANQQVINDRLHNLLDEDYEAVFLWRMDPILTNDSKKFDSLNFRGENSFVYDLLRKS